MELNKKYITKEPLESKCCDTVIPANTEIEIIYKSSKNIVYIIISNSHCIHKVKLSSLRRVVGENK